MLCILVALPFPSKKGGETSLSFLVDLYTELSADAPPSDGDSNKQSASGEEVRVIMWWFSERWLFRCLCSENRFACLSDRQYLLFKSYTTLLWSSWLRLCGVLLDTYACTIAKGVKAFDTKCVKSCAEAGVHLIAFSRFFYVALYVEAASQNICYIFCDFSWLSGEWADWKGVNSHRCTILTWNAAISSRAHCSIICPEANDTMFSDCLEKAASQNPWGKYFGLLLGCLMNEILVNARTVCTGLTLRML